MESQLRVTQWSYVSIIKSSLSYYFVTSKEATFIQIADQRETQNLQPVADWARFPL